MIGKSQNKRKKVTIIKKIKRKDGSIDRIKQEFYKDYGENFA